MEEVENMRHRNKKSDSYDFNKVLSHLGLPEYEYIDAQNYDYLLPTHLTYGKEQTVKIHNTKIMSNIFTGNYRFRNELYGPIDEDAVLHIDTRTGQIKFRWDAKIFYMLYDLTIDHTVNFWLTDIAMHQVFV
ncbi:unnamed protein product [Rotaria sp. Silwood2]|nr:unnamed protein product [Rotaria sp. Silwood2]CAF4502088.1 unnamed protein product [Rotaria sp. Silwood2]